MASPKVYAIFWDEYFDRNRAVVGMMEDFLRKILRGRYMDQLAQYGVGKGEFVGSAIVVPDPEEPPPSSSIMEAKYIERQLLGWIRVSKVAERPSQHEKNLLYIIFTPSTTNIGDCVCGYHQSGLYDKDSGDPNLFWAAIQEWHHDGPEKLPATPRDFADSCTWAVCHEMVEAFTNPDGKGYHTEDECEIGDICECAQGSESMKTPIIKAEVDGWWVETYWDNENQSCYPLHIVPRRQAPEVGYPLPGENV